MIIYVNARARGSNDGSSWRNAYSDLQDALRIANPGTVIRIAGNATYKPTRGTNRSESFVIPDGVRVFGGFSGNENQPNQRNIAQYPTILDGNIGSYRNQDNSYTVVTVENVSNVTLDGLVITSGNANLRSLKPYSMTKETDGGGVFIKESQNITLRNLEIKNNFANNGGGLVNVQSENIQISNSKFTNNNAIRLTGGAITNQSSNMVINSSLFNNNQAFVKGGAINSFNSQIIITRSSFEQNKTILGDGGAIEIEGVYRKNPSLQSLLNKVKFLENRSGDDGGAIEISAGAKVFGNRLYFKDNESGSLIGSAILVEQASSTIVNSYFNTDDTSPQYFVTHGSSSPSRYVNSLVNSTVLSSSPGASKAIINVDVRGGTVRLHNNIIWNENPGNGYLGIKVNGSYDPRKIIVSRNIVNGGFPGGNWSLDPNLNSNNFTLKANSPAINQGNNRVYLNTFEQVKNYPSIFNKSQDIRWRQRIVGNAIDLGASESSHNQLPDGSGGTVTLAGGVTNALLVSLPLIDDDADSEIINYQLIDGDGFDLDPDNNSVVATIFDGINGTENNDKISGTNEEDTINGLGGNDTLIGRSGDDRLIGDAGNDLLKGNRGDDFLDGGNDNDTLIGGAGNDSLYGGTEDYLNGGNGDDLLVGYTGDDILIGGMGDDTIKAGLDNDSLYGGAGNDYLVGGIGVGNNGKDRLTGGAGNDTLIGGGSRDKFVFASGFGTDIITDFGTGNDKIDLTAFSLGTGGFNTLDIDTTTMVGSSIITSTTTPGFGQITLNGFTGLDAGDFIFVYV